MDKTKALDRLTFCGECGYWKPSNDNRIKEEYRDYIGYCSRPYEGMIRRDRDDFCSRGYVHVILDTKRED
jgi:hypothetical protein